VCELFTCVCVTGSGSAVHEETGCFHRSYIIESVIMPRLVRQSYLPAATATLVLLSCLVLDPAGATDGALERFARCLYSSSSVEQIVFA